jgi:GcrA cell cycle regulator
MNSDFWTDRRVRILTSMWEAEKSASVIAGALNCTRDMVIGKAHRLGLKARLSPIKADAVLTEQRRAATRKKRRYYLVNQRRESMGLPPLPREA